VKSTQTTDRRTPRASTSTACPLLRSSFGYARTASRIGKQFLQAGEGPKVAPHSPPYPCIRFNVFDVDKRDLCNAIVAKLEGSELLMEVKDEAWGAPMFVAFLSGPVDLLRCVADFVEADWILL
jgi:hypothetical protein